MSPCGTGWPSNVTVPVTSQVPDPQPSASRRTICNKAVCALRPTAHSQNALLLQVAGRFVARTRAQTLIGGQVDSVRNNTDGGIGEQAVHYARMVAALRLNPIGIPLCARGLQSGVAPHGAVW